MADWYVATTGDDGNPGTQGSPFLTIGHAIVQASNLDVIHIAEGSYLEKFTVNKNVQILGGYQNGSWVRDFNQYITTVDARTLTTGSDVIDVLGNSDPLIEGIIVRAGDWELNGGNNDAPGPAIDISQNSSPTLRYCEFHGPRSTNPNNKLYTIRPRSAGANPLFKFCKIYGPKGATPAAAPGGASEKIETCTPVKAQAVYEDCEIFDGADGRSQHRTMLESENSGTTMIRCNFHAVDGNIHHGVPQFKLLTCLTNASFKTHWHKCRSSVLRGAINAGNATSAVIWWQTTDLDGPFMDYSQIEMIDCDLILGTGTDTRFVEDNDVQRHIDLVNNAGGTWENTRLWNSEEEYQAAQGGGGGTRPKKAFFFIPPGLALSKRSSSISVSSPRR